jgi:hypothetical protein
LHLVSFYFEGPSAPLVEQIRFETS